MKKIIYLAAAVLMITLASCGSKQADKNVTEDKAQVVDVTKGQTVEEILATAGENVGKEVVIRGIVDHTCTHSGRRCFILGTDPSLTMRVEATGNIGGFNRELSGSEIAIKGILREQFVSPEEIAKLEEQLKAKEEKEGADHCDSEAKAIQSMRQWMKDHNRESYSEYYIDGTDYEVVE